MFRDSKFERGGKTRKQSKNRNDNATGKQRSTRTPECMRADARPSEPQNRLPLGSAGAAPHALGVDVEILVRFVAAPLDLLLPGL